MHEGQEKFYNFILERVKEEKLEEAKALLLEGFEKQADNTFNADYMASYISKMTSLLKDEHVDEVAGIMSQFRG